MDMRTARLRLAGGAIVFGLGLSGCAVQPINIAALPSNELCVDLATTTLTGQPYSADAFHHVQQSELVNEIHSRGEQCQPWGEYMKVAYARLELQLQRDQQAAQGIAAGAALMEASRPVIVPQTMHNTMTTCGWNGPQWQCNSTGN
jgi:hypothetical protein